MNSLEIGKQIIMPESVKALGSVVMFWNPQNHPEEVRNMSRAETREDGLAEVAERIGVQSESLTGLTWEGLNLVDVLWTMGNHKAAIELATNPHLADLIQDLLVDTAAGLIQTARNKSQHVPNEWITVDRKQLEQSLTRLDQDTDLWIKQWMHWLETLDLSSSGTHLRPETIERWGAGDMASGHWSP